MTVDLKDGTQCDAAQVLTGLIFTIDQSEEDVAQFVRSALGRSHEDLSTNDCRAPFYCKYHADGRPPR